MKTFYFILFLFFFTSEIISAQWYLQESGTTADLRGVWFVDSLYGWACGDSGIVLHTSNGGQVWQRQNSNVTVKLEDVFFWDLQTGWVVGDSGTIIHTTNRGVTWIEQQTTITSKLHHVQFVTPLKGYATGESNCGLSTYDGGNNWQVSLGCDTGTASVSFFWIDEGRGMILFADTSITSLYHTVDGGITWSVTGIPPFYLYDVWGYRAFYTSHHRNFYWVVGENGWIFWIIIIEEMPQVSYALIGQTDDTLDLYAVILEPIEPLGTEPLKLWAVGLQGWIISSIDSGLTWQTSQSNVPVDLFEVSFPVRDQGWVVGNNGTILYTPNGGIPVELVSFTADVYDNDVLLNWLTATETNNMGFEIERKVYLNSTLEGIKEEWNMIGFIPGFGTTTEPKSYSYIDKNCKVGYYNYRLKQIDFDGTYEYSPIVEVEVYSPKSFKVQNPYPNPFNPTTTIEFQINRSQKIVIDIFDVIGQKAAQLVNEIKEPGTYMEIIDGSELTSGLYFCRIQAGENVATKKLILLK